MSELEACLIDTQVVIWAGIEPTKLSQLAGNIIRDGRIQRLLSSASVWEMAIKWSLGKLDLGGDPSDFIDHQTLHLRLTHLPITSRHALRTRLLPRLHSDPFDRLLIAQAFVEGVPIITADPRFAAYGVELIW